MRQKRAKAYRKLMHLYCMSFGFRQPYQVLIDSEMCKAAVSQKLDFTKQLSTVLQGDVKPMITQCCIHELYLQGKAQQPAVDLAKNFERRKCNHREPIPGDECLESVIGDKNKHRYVVATQSHPLRIKLRLIQATPIVHINRSVIVLEPPSDVTLKAKEAAEAQKLNATTAPDLALVGPSAPEERKVKRKGPKGPNPLSVKKKKVELEKGKKKPLSKEDSVAAKAGTKRKAEDSEEEHDPEEVQAEETQAGLLTPAAKRRKRKRKKMAGSITQTNVESTDANVD